MCTPLASSSEPTAESLVVRKELIGLKENSPARTRAALPTSRYLKGWISALSFKQSQPRASIHGSVVIDQTAKAITKRFIFLHGTGATFFALYTQLATSFETTLLVVAVTLKVFRGLMQNSFAASCASLETFWYQEVGQIVGESLIMPLNNGSSCTLCQNLKHSGIIDIRTTHLVITSTKCSIKATFHFFSFFFFFFSVSPNPADREKNNK
jgi:hypothetical protein